MKGLITIVALLFGVLMVGCLTLSNPRMVRIPNSVRERLPADCRKQTYAYSFFRTDYELFRGNNMTTCEISDGDALYFVMQEQAIVRNDGPQGKWTTVIKDYVYVTERK